MIQYTRLFRKTSTGEILACHSQTTPFKDGESYIDYNDPDIEHVDFEAECDNVPEGIVRARELLETLEVGPNGQPRVKNPTGRVRNVTARKGIEMKDNVGRP